MVALKTMVAAARPSSRVQRSWTRLPRQCRRPARRRRGAAAGTAAHPRRRLRARPCGGVTRPATASCARRRAATAHGRARPVRSVPAPEGLLLIVDGRWCPGRLHRPPDACGGGVASGSPHGSWVSMSGSSTVSGRVPPTPDTDGLFAHPAAFTGAAVSHLGGQFEQHPIGPCSRSDAPPM